MMSHEALINPKLIEAHLKVIHQAAEGVSGKLVLASFGQDPVTGKDITPKIEQFNIGKYRDMARTTKEWASEPHRNVYCALAVLKTGVKGRGETGDYSHVFGLVADFDDSNAADYEKRLPLPPRIVIQSSESRYQCHYLFTKPVDIEGAKEIGKRLVAYSGCDACSADPIHVWRILGALNWPNKNKVNGGRSTEPQTVTLVSKGDKFIDPAALLEALPPVESAKQSKQTVDSEFIQPAADVDEVREALNSIRADLPYDIWVRVLAALHSEGLYEEGRDWSMRDERFDQHEFDSKWNSFDKNKPDGVTIATLFMIAKEFKHNAEKAVMDNVINKLKSDKDCAAHFENNAIAAAAYFREQDIQLCRHYRREIKKVAKGSADILNWDKEINEKLQHSDEQGSCPDDASHHVIATHLIDRLESEIGADVVAVAGVLHTYNKDNGTYQPLSEDKTIVSIAEQYDGSKNCNRNSDYKAIYECVMRLRDQPGHFDHAPVGVATMGQFHRISGDGVIITETLSHEHRCRFAYDFEPSYHDAVLWFKHLHRCFKDNDEENQILLLQEIVGAVLFRLASSMQQAFLFLGPSATGKSTTQTVIELLIPGILRSASSPFSWDKEYNIATLSGKLLNCVGELPDDKCIPAADFKRVIGGDTLEGRHPTHRPFHFRNSAAHIFNSNHLINTRDRTNAFWRRWRIVEFANVIPGQRDPNYGEQLKGELPQILGWAFEGAKRLVANNYQFTNTEPHERKMAEWQVAQNSAAEFLDDAGAVTLGETLQESGYKAYLAYQEWCRDVGRQPLGRSKFYEELNGDAGKLRKIARLPSRRDGLIFVGFSLVANVDEFDIV